MVFDLVPIRPNPREAYQRRVERLCNLLKDEEGSSYRVPDFQLLTIPGTLFCRKGFTKFRQHPQAKLFLNQHSAHVRALEILNELDAIYAGDSSEIDHLRGAVGEVFSYFICRKIYPRADIEVQVRIGVWTSGSIDAAGCSQERGHCLQSKCSLDDWDSIRRQKDDLSQIETLSGGKAEGFFITYIHRDAFYLRLTNAGLDPSEYKVLDSTDLLLLEDRLAS